MSARTLPIDDRLHQYVVDHSVHEHPVLAELREVTRKHQFGGMQIGPDQGRAPSNALKRYFVGAVSAGFGRIASAVPWMNACNFGTSSSFNLSVKSGMPRSMYGPLNTKRSRFAITSVAE